LYDNYIVYIAQSLSVPIDLLADFTKNWKTCIAHNFYLRSHFYYNFFYLPEHWFASRIWI